MSQPYIKKKIGCFKHSKSRSQLFLQDTNNPSLPQIGNKSSFMEYINSNPKLRTRNISSVNNIPLTNDTSSLEQSSSFVKSQNWKKVSNLFQSISLLRSFDAKSLTKENDIDNDITFYKNHLPLNSKLRDELSSNNPQLNCMKRNQKVQKVFRDALINNKLCDCHILRENFKEEIAYNILYNNSNVLEAIEDIYKYNPDRNIRNELDSEFIFNTPLEKNGKTLLYLACQEGKKDIVEYFLNKKLSPKVKSKIDKNTYETPLECACRWGYSKIVKLLLEKVKYSNKEINKVIKMKGLSRIISDMLNLYLKTINRKRVSCFCI